MGFEPALCGTLERPETRCEVWQVARLLCAPCNRALNDPRNWGSSEPVETAFPSENIKVCEECLSPIRPATAFPLTKPV